MSNSSSSSSGGIGFLGLLTIVFITLKLGIGNTAVMGWSWWWVLSPIWGGFALLLVFFLIALVIGLIASAFGARPYRRR